MPKNLDDISHAGEPLSEEEEVPVKNEPRLSVALFVYPGYFNDRILDPNGDCRGKWLEEMSRDFPDVLG